jgi:mRNA interferase MazF
MTRSKRADFKRGDVLLIPFPFTDSVTQKQRPAVVVSTAAYISRTIDVIVAMVSSKSGRALRPGDHSLSDWRGAGLIGPSIVRPRLATVHVKRVVRKLGSVSSSDMTGIEQGLRLSLGL